VVVEANAVVEKDLSNHGDYDYVCSDGKVVCYGCKSAVDSIDSPVVVTAACEPSESREVSVTLSLKAVAPILASRFAIDAPDGFTLVSAESLIGIADEAATGFTLVLPDSTSLPYDVIVMNMSLEDATIDAAVLKLTFAVEESGTHKVSVSALETYNCEKESIDTFAISAEITAEEHTHEYEAKITAPTCTEDGFTTYTCACGDSFVADETDATGHIWDGGKVTSPATPDAAGIKIYTCTVCGETKETTFSCTEHVYVAKTDGTYYCANGCEVSAPDAPVVVSIAPIAANGEEVTVTVSVRATTPIVAHRFRVNAPEGFTLSSINSLLGEAAANATGWTLTGENNTAVPCDISLFNMSGTDDAIDCTVAEFTFTVTDTVENGTYVFVVDSLETYNYSEEAIDAVSVDAEVTYVTHIHDYKVVVTVPTCTEGGYTTYTCECGDTYVADEVAALGHTEEILTAVEPTYESTGLTEGKKCSVCGEILVAQEEIPALEKPVISGDINGDGTVTIADALLLIRVILNDETIENGDVNGDGKVGLADVIRTIKLISQ
ncbi:MAG: dockerin type I repeat-containing protein, partial [Clostridia bacterium]|nr:dockerin type I repeat-containing protein [Clostridia bacterium]